MKQAKCHPIRLLTESYICSNSTYLVKCYYKMQPNMKLQHQMKQANMQAKAKMLHQIAVPKQEAQARQVHNIPVDFILFTDTTLTNNMHHPNTMLVVLKADEQSSATPPLCRNPIFTVSCKQHTQIIHINLTHLLSNPE